MSMKVFNDYMGKQAELISEELKSQYENLPIKSKREILSNFDIPRNLEGMGKKVIELENAIENFNDEDKARFNKLVLEKALFDRETQRVIKEANIQSINVYKTIKRYIKTLESNSTKDSYERGIDKFMVYVKNIGKDLLHCDKTDAENYRNYVKGLKESVSTKRIRIISMKSFYNYLNDHYSYITNIFSGIKTFRMVNKKEVNIPDSKREINKIRRGILNCMVSKSRGLKNTQLVAIVDIICKYGFRVGAFSPMEINKNRKFKTTSKCREFKGTFDEATFKLITGEFGAINSPKMPFKHLNSRNLSSLFKYHTNKLCNEGTIKYAYSLHDLRHWFAIRFYKETNDIVRTSKALGHANLQVTGVYFKQYFDIDLYNK